MAEVKLEVHCNVVVVASVVVERLVKISAASKWGMDAVVQKRKRVVAVCGSVHR